RARLAEALLLYTGQRRSDVIRIGPQHIRNGKIHVKQQKTGKELRIKIHPELAAVMAATPTEHLTFLVTQQRSPFTSSGFGNRLRHQCEAAGRPSACRSHGLRKAAARRLAEAGCTPNEIASITGHQTLKEVSRYTAAADQERLADAAIAKMKTRTPSVKL